MAAKKKAFPTDPAVLAVYQTMVDAVPGVPLKGATTPYTAINGNMYSSVSKADVIGLRLSKDDRDTFLARYDTTLFEGVPGHFMKEYVAVPPALHGDTRTLRRWFRKSHAYASSLKPKKTTR